jgi:hypothetical protein
MIQPRRIWLAVAKEGRVKAAERASTQGCSESIIHHMGDLSFLGACYTLKDRRNPLSFHPSGVGQYVFARSGKLAKVQIRSSTSSRRRSMGGLVGSACTVN